MKYAVSYQAIHYDNNTGDCKGGVHCAAILEAENITEAVRIAKTNTPYDVYATLQVNNPQLNTTAKITIHVFGECGKYYSCLLDPADNMHLQTTYGNIRTGDKLYYHERKNDNE